MEPASTTTTDRRAHSEVIVMRWIKSSFSFSNSNCVEVAARQGRQGAERLVRDSKDPSGPVLTFLPAAWDAFVRKIKTGTYSPS
jgi:hypothetical protein